MTTATTAAAKPPEGEQARLLLAELAAQGIHLEVEGENLRPSSKLPPALRAELAAHKPALLDHLHRSRQTTVMPTPTANLQRFDAGGCLAFLEQLHEPGAVFEVRILNTRQKTVSGFFNDPALAVQAVERWSGQAPGVYATLNPVNPALLARSANRLTPYAKQTTADTDITCRRWLLVDTDAIRPAGISSTDDEHAAAMARARQVREWLTAQGWPDPILADSGNGGHLLYRIDLPNDTDSLALVESCLKALAFQFDGEAVKVDTGVGNAARISKLYGTLVCKGDSTADRTHRLAGILEKPAHCDPVSVELLRKLAAQVPAQPQTARHNGRTPQPGLEFDLEQWIEESRLPILRSGPWQEGTRYVLETCPNNPEHTGGCAYIVQLPSGAIAAGCHHDSCQDFDWHALRKLVDPSEERHAPAVPTQATEGEEPAGGSYSLTDDGLADRLVARHGRDLRHCHERGWMVWKDGQWQGDRTGEVRRRAVETARAIPAEAAGEDGDRAKELYQFAGRSLADYKIKAMLNSAESKLPLPALLADFDQNPWLFNCDNGTLDLRTGQLRNHRREDLITRRAPVIYDPAAKCLLWEKFLHRIFADRMGLLGYLQRIIGYTLTGLTQEQVFFLLYGLGANGKTVLLSILRAMLGDFAEIADFSSFLAKQGDSIRNDLARLVGSRLVVAAEAEGGRRLSESTVKQLTGGDSIVARFLHREFFEFRPEFKLWLATNHKPVIRGTDHAIWRRVKLIPFDVTIPESERDPNLTQKLRTELPGILAWAVKGCLEWQEMGLGEPDEVRTATGTYREEQDTLAAFLETVEIPDSGLRASELYAAYTHWCAQNAEEPANQRVFGLRMVEKGPQKRRTKQGFVYLAVYDNPPVYDSAPILAISQMKILHEGNTEKSYTTLHPTPQAAPGRERCEV